jgi:hypothetical protein
MDALVAKLLHAPSVALKKQADHGDGVDLVEAAHRLFDLPPLEPLASAEAIEPRQGKTEAAVATEAEGGADEDAGAPGKKAVRS